MRYQIWTYRECGWDLEWFGDNPAVFDAMLLHLSGFSIPICTSIDGFMTWT